MSEEAVIDPPSVEEPEEEEEARGALFFESLRVTLGRVWVWIIVWLLHALLAVAPAFAFYAWFKGATANRYEPGSIFANLDGTFRADHESALSVLHDTNARVGAILVLFAMLVSIFCAGGWLQVFLEFGKGRSFRRFFFGGARYFARFFRLFLLTLITLAAISWVVYGMPWETFALGMWRGIPEADFDKLETLGSEWSATWLFWGQDALFALLFALVLVWGDYTRTRLALQDTSSVLWAGLCTFVNLIIHPFRTLRPMIALFLVELVVVFGAGMIARSIEDQMFEHPELLGAGFLLLIGQLVLVWRLIVRGARYHAAIEVSREIVRPLSRPDPWKQSIGGPGGPRYPIGGDEYTTSL